MVIKDLSPLKNSLKSGNKHNLYLILGQEQYLCNMAYNQLLYTFLTKEEQTSALTILDGEKTSPQELSDTIEAMPMIGDLRVVVIDNPNITKISTDKYDTLLSSISDIPPYTIVIIYIKSTEFDYEKNKRCKDIYTIADKTGTVLIFEKQAQGDIVEFIIRSLKKENKEISKSNAIFLITRCGTDMSILNKEINKLSYVSSPNITQDIIETITIESIEAQIYDLSKAVSSANLDKSMEIIDKLYYLRQPPVVILSALSYFFADLYRAKIGKEQNIDVGETATSFGYRPSDFRMKNAYRDCSKYHANSLTDILEILAMADFHLKSSRMDDRIIIEKCVADIFNIIRKKR